MPPNRLQNVCVRGRYPAVDDLIGAESGAGLADEVHIGNAEQMLMKDICFFEELLVADMGGGITCPGIRLHDIAISVLGPNRL